MYNKITFNLEEVGALRPTVDKAAQLLVQSLNRIFWGLGNKTHR